MKQYKLLTLTFFIMVMIGSQCFGSYKDKNEVEQNLERKAQHLLDTMFGPNQMSVLVKVDMGLESWRVKYTGRAKIRGMKKKPDETAPKFQILPGYNALKNLSPNEQVSVPFNSEIQKVPPRIKKITLDIIVSKAIRKSSAKKSGKLLIKLLQLNPKRGDKVNFSFQKFPVIAMKEEAEGTTVEISRPMTTSDQLFIVALVLLGCFITLYTILQLKALKSSEAAIGGSGGAAPPPPPSPAKKLEKSGGGGAQGASMKVYFDFVDDGNIHKVLSIIEQEKLAPEHVAIIASYLSAGMSAQVLGTMGIKNQVAIVTKMIEQKVLNKELVGKLELKIKGRLERMVGGDLMIENLFSEIPNDRKKSILEVLEKDKESYSKIRPNVLLFDDIQYLPDKDMKKFVTEVNLDSLSAALMGAESKTRKKVEASLSDAAKSMVAQFADLKGDSITQDEIEMGQMVVLNKASELDKTGVLPLKANVPGMAKPTK